MKLEMSYLEKDEWYIYLSDCPQNGFLGSLYSDKDIAKQLDMSTKKYQKTLKSFGGYLKNPEECKYKADAVDTYFYTKEECKNALNYLKEKYEVIFALRETFDGMEN